MNKEMTEKLKDNIKKLVEQGQLNQAKSLLEEYKKIVKDDIDIYSIMGIIYMMEGNRDDAEAILKKGLELDSNDFDLLYNIAYFYQSNEQKELAIEKYVSAYYVAKTSEEKEEITQILKGLGIDEIPKKQELPSRKYSKTKLVFFVKKGMDNFLGDIIDNLSLSHEVKKIEVNDYKQIDAGMQWADISWFEWCDELIIYGSKLAMAKHKKIICRLHSYEAFSNYPNQVNWESVDKVIFVAETLLEYVVQSFNVDRKKTVVIPNGVDLSSWKFKKRKVGFNVAYVGYINYKKGPMLLLQTFKAIYDKDRRYKFYIAGEFQDPRDMLYFKQMIKEFGLEKNFFFNGWQKNLDSWLEDKSYILCTSVLESQNMSVMQGMAKGIKPLVHNFVGAKSIYPKAFIWNTIDEAVSMITEKTYDSQEYRNYIDKNYSLEKQNGLINALIQSINKISLSDSINDNTVEFIYDSKLIKFYLPIQNDFIQKAIYTNRSFYESGMLEDIKKRLPKNSIVVDVGANIGNHTVFFSKVCGAQKVYSFEPQDGIFKILKRNVEINGLDRKVELYNMGVGSHHYFSEIKQVDQNNLGMAKIFANRNGNVEVNKLDYLILNHCQKIDLIKIDVEGMEIEVLEGAKQILKKFKPILYLEAGTDLECNNLVLFLKNYGYKPILRFNATPTYLFVCIE